MDCCSFSACNRICRLASAHSVASLLFVASANWATFSSVSLHGTRHSLRHRLIWTLQLHHSALCECSSRGFTLVSSTVFSLHATLEILSSFLLRFIRNVSSTKHICIFGLHVLMKAYQKFSYCVLLNTI